MLDDLIPQISSEIVFVTGDFSFIPRMRIGKKNEALDKIFKKILEKSNNATIVFPLASLNLCNTNIPFILNSTPSFEMGSFSEFLRKKNNTFRSLHPFWSVGAIGPLADKLTKNISPHAYAVNSIWDRLCNYRAKQITIGKKVSDAITTVHHCECICGVPYRYTKEFSHPIELEPGIIKEKLFYLSVFYKNLRAQKRIKRNQHFFESLNRKQFSKFSINLTNNMVVHSSLLDLYSFRENTTNIISDDTYTYLEYPPEINLRKYRY